MDVVEMTSGEPPLDTPGHFYLLPLKCLKLPLLPSWLLFIYLFFSSWLLSRCNLVLFHLKCTAHNFTKCFLRDTISWPLCLRTPYFSGHLAKCFVPDRYRTDSTIIVDGALLYEPPSLAKQHKLEMCRGGCPKEEVALGD